MDGWMDVMYCMYLMYVFNVCMYLMYVCMYRYACMHAYRHTCIDAYMYVCVHTCIHTYKYTYIHRYLHTSISACIPAYMFTQRADAGNDNDGRPMKIDWSDNKEVAVKKKYGASAPLIPRGGVRLCVHLFVRLPRVGRVHVRVYVDPAHMHSISCAVEARSLQSSTFTWILFTRHAG